MRKILVQRRIKGLKGNLFQHVQYSHDSFHSHEDVARHVEDRHPFTITIIVEKAIN